MTETYFSASGVFVGVDVAKADHWAHAVAAGGQELFSRAVANDEAAIDALIDEAAGCGAVVLVIDQTGSAAALLLEAAARRGVPVAYVPGLVMRQSSGRVGNCWDSSIAESFFATLKRELVSQHRFQNRDQARRAIFAWIGRYNTQRIHSTLDYQTPTE